MNLKNQSFETLSELKKILKKARRTKGLTYLDLAKKLKISEPTVKRWLNGQGIQLFQWLQLLEVLELDLTEIASVLNSPSTHQFEYTERQEKKFVQMPGLLAFFQALLGGSTPIQIAEKQGLSGRFLSSALKALDQIGLAEWQTGLDCRLKMRGEPVWIKNGPLQSHFREETLKGFLIPRYKGPKMDLGFYELTLSDATFLKDEIRKVFLLAQRLEKKSRILKSQQHPHCIAVCFDQYAPGFLYRNGII